MREELTELNPICPKCRHAQLVLDHSRPDEVIWFCLDCIYIVSERDRLLIELIRQRQFTRLLFGAWLILLIIIAIIVFKLFTN